LVITLVALAFYLVFTWNVLLLHTQSLLHLNDLGKFYYDAQAFVEGGPMYGLSPATNVQLSETTSKQFLNLNPPHMHLIMLPLAFLDPPDVLGVWLLSGLACLAVVVWKALRATGTIPSTRLLLWSGLALASSAAFGSILVTGQITMHLLPLITWAWIAARRQRWNQAAVALGLCISIKPFLLVFLPWLAIRGRVSAACLSLLAVALCFAVGVAVFGVDNHSAWLAALSAIDWHDMPLNASLLGFLERALRDTFYFEPLIDAPTLPRALWLAGFTLIGLASLSTALLDRSSEATDRAFCILLLASLLMCPLGWMYYLLLALPPAIGLLRCRNSEHWGTSSNKKLAKAICVGALSIAGVLVFIPTSFVIWGQPSGTMTISLGSAHFWTVFLLWITVFIDGQMSLGMQGVRLRSLARILHDSEGVCA